MKRLVPAIDRALRDFEERKQRRLAELRIREQAEMLDQAREAIFVTDLSNRLTYWNAGAERLFGWPSDEVLGRTTDYIFDSTMTANIKTGVPRSFWKKRRKCARRSKRHLQSCR